MSRVVITGVGMSTPLGGTVASSWAGLLEGRSAIGPITRFDPTGYPVRFAAEATDPGEALSTAGWPDLPEDALHDLKSRLAFVAVTEALAQSGIPAGGDRVGVCIGSEASRPPLSLVAERLLHSRPPPAAELARMSPDAPTRMIAAMLGATGPMSTISTACTSSSQAVGEGMLQIRRGRADAMIVGGVDVLVDPIMITGFSLLGALSTRNDDPTAASRPFDIDRDGFVLGEGAGFLVLESEDNARGRGAEILGVLSGFGCSCNAYRITDSPPDGRGAAQSMTAALADAGLSADQLDYINAHGTSTQQNDASETQGIHRALGSAVADVPVSSTKSAMGHLVAACGAVEVILCLQAIRDGVVPATLNLHRPDPVCDLHHVPLTARRATVRHAMTNAFGFGGSNGSVVVSAI
jgi:3-oxoacyl-[acyl-carrier-protein] synthase II